MLLGTSIGQAATDPAGKPIMPAHFFPWPGRSELALLPRIFLRGHSLDMLYDMMLIMSDSSRHKDKPVEDRVVDPLSRTILIARELSTNPTFFLSLIGSVILFGVGQMLLHDTFSVELIRKYLAYALMGLGALLFMYLYLKLLRKMIRRRVDEPSFLELDRWARRSDPNDRIDAAIDEIRRLASRVTSERVDFSSLIEKLQESRNVAEPPPATPESFQAQMSLAVGVLERKAKLADEKASALLDRGVTYSKFGIGFFIVAIVAWQFLAWWKGFATQFIFGIASSTVLFVFLQFLSSWFLKQYRHFVEVSTYLIEIKSVFDRYALLYLLAREADGKGQAESASISALVGSLQEEMKWPRARPGFTDDVYYAKDAISATDEVVKIVRLGARTKVGAKVPLDGNIAETT